MPHQPLVMALARYRTDLPRLSQCGWLAEFDILQSIFSPAVRRETLRVRAISIAATVS
jgi:hypothetical protein